MICVIYKVTGFERIPIILHFFFALLEEEIRE